MNPYVECLNNDMNKNVLYLSFISYMFYKFHLSISFWGCVFTLTGNCARMTAAKIKAHPDNSRTLSFWCNKRKPAKTEKTDSKLMSKDATAGFTSSCPMICSVYATPQERIPAYKRGIQASDV